MAIDHLNRVHLGEQVEEEPSHVDGHYSTHADECDQAHLKYGREKVPMRLNPAVASLEELPMAMAEGNA